MTSRIIDQSDRGFVEVVSRLADGAGPDGMTLNEVLDHLDERAYGVAILVLSIPCLVPALYGVPQVLGVPMLLLAGQMLLGRQEPWLPSSVGGRRIPKGWLERMAGFADKRMRWFERVSRPRAAKLADGPGDRFAAGFMILAIVTIIIPFTNTVPSLAVALMCVGLIQRDGVFVAVGALVAVGWAGFVAALAVSMAFGAGWATGLFGG
ncbi:MAG TPA: exopolysaccharide biosynthesis protein [Caulobacteraceae bacterium]|nr:exopolysaccharide biosynthesis protein [Caulobacteraceae bacterium]